VGGEIQDFHQLLLALPAISGQDLRAAHEVPFAKKRRKPPIRNGQRSFASFTF
jgi:hypothetical protein